MLRTKITAQASVSDPYIPAIQFAKHSWSHLKKGVTLNVKVLVIVFVEFFIIVLLMIVMMMIYIGYQYQIE